MAQFLLVLVSTPDLSSPEDFAELAQWIMKIDSRIVVSVCQDEPQAASAIDACELPKLVFSPGPLLRLRPNRGALFQGRWLPKSVEYQRLEAYGLPVPRWAKMSPTETPSVEDLGPYVVVKPDLGARGADVRIARSKGLAWRPPRTRFATILGGPMAPSVVQRFIYTGPWARSYRVTTLFGEVLWSLAIEASHRRRRLLGPTGFVAAELGAGAPIVSSGKHCRMSLANEPDTLVLARRAHAAFPDIALLGIDMLREHSTGQLYIVEVNSAGLCWHFSSGAGRRLQEEFGFRLESQFDGRRLAARLLAERTPLLAK
jgi:hypothetical protein